MRNFRHAVPAARTLVERPHGQLLALALLLLLAVLSLKSVSAQAYPYPHCDIDEAPRFQDGLAALAELLGGQMGEPLECEHSPPHTADRHQLTTTGLAYRTEVGDRPSFTNGWDHWALTEEGLLYWAGPGDDPPALQELVEIPPRSPVREEGIVPEVATDDAGHVQIHAEEVVESEPEPEVMNLAPGGDAENPATDPDPGVGLEAAQPASSLPPAFAPAWLLIPASAALAIVALRRLRRPA